MTPPHVPASDAVAAVLDGALSLGALTDDALANVPLDALADRLVAGPPQGATPLRKLLAVHPGLATPAGALALLERLHVGAGAGREHTMSTLLVEALEAAAEASRIEVYARLAPSARADLRVALVRALLGAEHRPTVERLAGELDRAIAARPPVWSAGHATKWLAPHVQALLLLAGDDVAARLAPYFAPAAVADDAGAQVAATILLVGTGYLTRHEVVVRAASTATGAPVAPLARLAASLLSHKRLARVAKEILAELPRAEREALLAGAAAAPPVAPARARKPKRKEPAYAVGDRVRVFWSDEDWVGSPGSIASVTGDYVRVLDDVDGLSGVLHTSQIAPPLG